MTVDEELSQFDDNLRRLKIEYDVYFGGGSKKAPADLEWRIQATIKKFQDGRMSGAQRFKYNTLVNKYSIFNSLWQKKLRIKEEGYRRPQDAILAIQGVRQNPVVEEQKGHRHPVVAVNCSDPESDRDRLRHLYEQLQSEMQRAGGGGSAQTFESFYGFIRKKTDHLRQEYGCNSVEYSLQTESGKVRLKAKPTTTPTK